MIVFCLYALSKEGWQDGDTVKVIVLQLFITVFCRKILYTDKLAEGGHHVVKRQLQIVCQAGCHMPGPPGDEWDAGALGQYSLLPLTVVCPEC